MDQSNDSLDSFDDDFVTGTRQPRPRFDNTSFVRNIMLTDSVGSNISQSPKEKSSRSSLHGLFKNLGKKAHIWPRKRHESTCNMGGGGGGTDVYGNRTSEDANDPQETFRSRSKSLDVNYTNNILNDCDATYKIFDKIVREGKTLVVALALGVVTISLYM